MTKHDDILCTADNSNQANMFLKTTVYEIDAANADFFWLDTKIFMT